MPKIIRSRRRSPLPSEFITINLHQQHHNDNPAATQSAAQSWNVNTPRKVSFEDGHRSSNLLRSTPSTASSTMLSTSSNHSVIGMDADVDFMQSHDVVAAIEGSRSSTPTSIPTRIPTSVPACSSSPQGSSSRSLLKRPRPSVCLVDLAAAAEAEEDGREDSDSSSSSSSTCSSSSSTATIRHSNNDYCLSPTSTVEAAPEAAPSSPWGHFVDILIPLDEEEYESRSMNYYRTAGGGGIFSEYPGSSYEPYPKYRRNKRRCLSLKPVSTHTTVTKSHQDSSWREFQPSTSCAQQAFNGFVLQTRELSCTDTTDIMAMDKDEDSTKVENAFQKLHV